MLWTSTRHTIRHASSEINAPVADAYIDTIELFFPRLRTREQLQPLKKLGMLTQCRGKGPIIWGYRLTVHQPTITELQLLDALGCEYGGILTRIDVAYDFSGPDIKQLKTEILRHLVLGWRRKQPMREYNDTLIYWCGFSRGKKRPGRNLVLYADRSNKITGECDCVHLELRLLRRRVLKKNGINRLSDAININPSDLLRRHVRWTDVAIKYGKMVIRKAVKEDRNRNRNRVTDNKYLVRLSDAININPSDLLRRHVRWTDVAIKYGKMVIRKAVKEDRNRNRNRVTDNKYLDIYRANIAKRVTALLHRTGLDRAQTIRDCNPRTPIKVLPMPLSIPHELTFPRKQGQDD